MRIQQLSLYAQRHPGKVVEEHRLWLASHGEERASSESTERARQPGNDRRRDDGPKQCRDEPFVDPASVPVDQRARILAVAGEQLVGAFPCEDDFYVLAGQRLS